MSTTDTRTQNTAPKSGFETVATAIADPAKLCRIRFTPTLANQQVVGAETFDTPSIAIAQKQTLPAPYQPRFYLPTANRALRDFPRAVEQFEEAYRDVTAWLTEIGSINMEYLNAPAPAMPPIRPFLDESPVGLPVKMEDVVVGTGTQIQERLTDAFRRMYLAATEKIASNLLIMRHAEWVGLAQFVSLTVVKGNFYKRILTSRSGPRVETTTSISQNTEWWLRHQIHTHLIREFKAHPYDTYLPDMPNKIRSWLKKTPRLLQNDVRILVGD